MDERELLGMTLEQALRLLEREGKCPAVEWTAAPRGAHEVGEPRVVRVRDGRLTVARFPGAIRAADA